MVIESSFFFLVGGLEELVLLVLADLGGGGASDLSYFLFNFLLLFEVSLLVETSLTGYPILIFSLGNSVNYFLYINVVRPRCLICFSFILWTCWKNILIDSAKKKGKQTWNYSPLLKWKSKMMLGIKIIVYISFIMKYFVTHLVIQSHSSWSFAWLISILFLSSSLLGLKNA